MVSYPSDSLSACHSGNIQTRLASRTKQATGLVVLER